MDNVFLRKISRPTWNYRYARLRIAIALLLCSGLAHGGASAQSPQLQLITPPIPSSASTLLMPEQLPPTKPTVTYENGLLTITANNSTLGDILRDVRNETGAEIDIPTQTDERVAARLGPGPARDVVASLLAGSQFNYVLVGSESDSTALTQVLLFLRPPPEHPIQGLLDAHAGRQGPLASANEMTAEVTQQVGDPSDPALLMRSQQQMLQQHRQMIMEQFRQNAVSR